MPIPAHHVHRYLYHFTHIDNLPGVLSTGFLANNHPLFPARSRSIAATEIQERRAKMEVTCGPLGYVHDYVPLYFGSLSPMLMMVLLNKNVDQRDLIYFEYPISIILQTNTVFTDAAANSLRAPNFFNDPSQLDRLDWAAIDARTWTEHDATKKNRRMAEVLVHHCLPLAGAARVIGFDERALQRIRTAARVAGVGLPSIELENSYSRQHYLRAFDNSGNSFVVGPHEIAERFESACAEVEAARNNPNLQAPYARLIDLLSALRTNFGCIPQTAELVGLVSENGLHKRTVDIHTQEVVDKLQKLDSFKALSDEDRQLVELAAHLHDIGKGPKSRWAFSGGIQKVDTNHPVAAMTMMVHILSQQVGHVSAADARRLLKLVCYHDLVGDILGRSRDVQQLIEVAEDERDLDMLIALGQADAGALQEAWDFTFLSNAPKLRARSLAAIRRKT